MKKKLILKLLGLVILLSFSVFLLKPELTPELDNDFLDVELQRIEQHIAKHAIINNEVSKASVGWHLDHMLLVINNIYSDMTTNAVEDYEKGYNFTRNIMFVFKTIPRGKAKSPKRAVPEPSIIPNDIYEHLEEAKKASALINDLLENANFDHPIIGNLNRK